MKVYKHQEEDLKLEGLGPKKEIFRGKNRTEELESLGLKGGTENIPRGCGKN